MICDAQKQVVEFLSSPGNFGGAAVERIDTHLSHIFLVGMRVYKIKRAIRFDFVNFSTSQLRKASCEREIEINRRTAPGMYLGVVPLYCIDGRIAWNGRSDPVEWAVEMVRFDAEYQMDNLIKHRRLQADQVVSLAQTIANFHHNAECIPDARSVAKVESIVDQLSTALHGEQLSATRQEEVSRWSEMAISACQQWESYLDARRRHGWVRHCHGDMHTANICQFDGKLVPFDAIEFNDELSSIDVLYDLAFILMDLCRFHRRDFANLLLNQYLAVTRDYAGLAVLHLFLSLRACVRAMVLGLPGQPEHSEREAARYLDLANECLVHESTPQLIVIGGYSGTGKSTLATALAPKIGGTCGAVLLQSDVIRKHLAGKSKEQSLPSANYSDQQRSSIYQRMIKDARRSLRAGQSVILDATFLGDEQRSHARRLASQISVPYRPLWLAAPDSVLRSRIASRGADYSDADLDVLEKQLKHCQPPEDWIKIDASTCPTSTLANALEALNT